MTRTHKAVNLVGVFLPLLAFVFAVVYLWERMVGPVELALLFGGYVLTGLGITVGYHRLFTHRSFQTYKGVRYAFAVLGQMAVEGNVLAWVADHRKHHQFSDQDGDPHSPHGHGEGLWASLKGLWHAHTGWLFSEVGRADKARYAKDLLDDKGLRVISKLFLPMVLLSLLVPAGLGWLLIGGWYGFLAGLVWGGLVRVFLLHHVTWSINSICHFLGRRQFRSRDESRNVWLLSLISFGESFHNNHHAFPTSAYHGLKRLQTAFDPGAWVIWTLEKVGLAWKVVRIPPEKRAAKALRSA